MSLPDEAADDSLRASIAAEFDAAEKPDAAPAVDATPAPIAAESTEKSEPVVDERGRVHGADGKFIPKKTDAAPDKAAPAVTKTTEKLAITEPVKAPSTDATKASDLQPSTAANAPPVGWTADAKAEWDQLSPAIKAAVLKREVEISSGGRQWSEEKRNLESIVAPVRQAAARRGLQPGQAIQQLMAAQDYLDRDPASALMEIGRTYGLSVTVNGQQPQGSPPADGSPRIESRPASDPRIDALWQYVEGERTRQQETTNQTVQSFAADHPHFEALSDEIMALLPLVKQQKPNAAPVELLQDAYDRAVWANPMTRAATEAQRVADADAQRRARNSQEVGKARLAASSIRPTPPAGGPAIEQRNSIREELEAAFAAAR